MTDLREMVASVLRCRPEELPDDARLGETARWDSFAQLDIMLALEERFGIEINDETIRTYSELRNILGLST
jgi:acyl carrier protein